MHVIPTIGDVIPLATGDAIILDIHHYHGSIRVLASRAHPVHPFAVWNWDNGALFHGRYFKTLTEAETHWETS
jgi:hypothetical protein